jgi:hypothetical protein
MLKTSHYLYLIRHVFTFLRTTKLYKLSCQLPSRSLLFTLFRIVSFLYYDRIVSFLYYDRIVRFLYHNRIVSCIYIYYISIIITLFYGTILKIQMNSVTSNRSTLTYAKGMPVLFCFLSILLISMYIPDNAMWLVCSTRLG